MQLLVQSKHEARSYEKMRDKSKKMTYCGETCRSYDPVNQHCNAVPSCGEHAIFCRRQMNSKPSVESSCHDASMDHLWPL